MPSAEPTSSDAVMPRSRVIRDPVLGYVDVPGELDALVRSPAVQRLRNIAQNSRAVARYPSMSGSRFEHALGTMHLARTGWSASWRNTVAPAGSDAAETRDAFRREVIDSLRATEALDSRTAHLVGVDAAAGAVCEVAVEDTPLWHEFEHVVGLVVGAVGLLHDLGHPPFSHILEPFFDAHADDVLSPPRYERYARYRAAAAGHVQFHEWAGLEIFDAIAPDVFTWMPRSFLRTVLADRSDEGWASCLHSIIDGQFDVDRLDYLVRDAVNAGTEFGAIDSERLLDSLELHRVDGGGERRGWKIGLGARAISAFETLLVQRAQQYRWVVHHYAVVAANTALERAVRNAYELSPAAGAERPDVDYLSAAPLVDRSSGAIVDDHDCIAWLRLARTRLAALAAGTDDELLERKALTTVTLLDACDSFSVTPIPAWRNYQEFLARADQNAETVKALVEASPSVAPASAAHLRSAAAREAVGALLADLPARLNAALDERLGSPGDDSGVRAAEDLLTRLHPEIPVCGGAGFWLLTRVPFMALKDDFANIWRGDEEVGLSELSPFPLALTAIEVMRPRYFVFFVPFDRSAGDATKQQRREVGRLFFEALAATAGA